MFERCSESRVERHVRQCSHVLLLEPSERHLARGEHTLQMPRRPQAAALLGQSALVIITARGDDGAREALTRSLRSDPDWEVRAASARALGSHPSLSSAQALEEASAGDSRLEVRQAAARSLPDSRPR